MDARWWVWIGLAIFGSLLAYLLLGTPRSPRLEAMVLTLNDLHQDRMVLARTPEGEIEYRRIRNRIIPYFHRHSQEFSYIIAGRAAGFVKNFSIEAGPGRLLIIPQLTAMGLRTTGEEPLELLSFYVPASDALDEVQVLIGDIFPPGDPSSLSPEAVPKHDREIAPEVLDLSLWKDRQLDNTGDGWEWSYVAKSLIGSVALVRVADRLQLKERATHFLYLRLGQARITVGERVLEAAAGQVVIVPSGSIRMIQRIGAETLESLLFSVPALREKDLF